MLTEGAGTDSSGSNGDATEPTTKAGKAQQRSGGRRTHRACDRCRVKKSKCNGQQPCNTCKANERTCVFSALRRRDIRKWHCHMQDTVDEAIQRLYRACKESSSFPGILPEERDGYVTTEQILQGMGFSNLDLGPRAGGVTGPGALQMSPFHTQFTNLPTEQQASSGHRSRSRGHFNPHRSSDAGSIDTAMTVGSPQAHPDFHRTPMIPNSFQQRSPTIPLTMSDQFLEAVGGHPVLHNPPPHYLPSQNISPSYPHSPQHLIHEQRFDQSELASQSPISPGPMNSIARSHLPFEYRNHFSIPQDQVYNGGSFINPQQLWPTQQRSSSGVTVVALTGH